MDNDFSTGKPPRWRIMVYALIVWAIIFFSSYSQLAEMHQYKYLFWIFIPLPGLFIIYFGFIHEKLKKQQDGEGFDDQILATVEINCVFTTYIKRAMEVTRHDASEYWGKMSFIHANHK